VLDKLTRHSFEPLIGQKFRLSVPDSATIDLELVEVELLPAGRRSRRAGQAPRREPFSLFFTAASLLPQAMYPIQHDAFGSDPLPIFIVPIGKADGGGYEYEAVFT